MMKHYFKRTAAFTIAGAIMLGSAAMPTLALEEIPEVDDIPATVEQETAADIKSNSDEKQDISDIAETISGKTDNDDYSSLLTYSNKKEDIAALKTFVDELNGAEGGTYNLQIVARNIMHNKIFELADDDSITSVVKFLNAVLGAVKNDANTDLYTGSTNINSRKVNSFCADSIDGDGGGVIDIYNNYIKILGSVYYTETPTNIMTEIADLSNKYLPGRETISAMRAKNPPKSSYTVDFEKQTIRSNAGIESACNLMDRVTCSIVNDKSFYDSLFDSVASTGETIKCTIEMYWEGSPLAILTLDGSKGTEKLWYRPSSQGQGNTLDFFENQYIKDNKLITDRFGVNGARGQFVFTGKATANDLKVQYFPHEDLKESESVRLTDCKYTQTEYGKESMKKYGGGLRDALGFTAEEAAAITGRNVEEKDDVDTGFGPKEKPTENKDKNKSNEKYADTLNSIGLLRGTENGYELDKTFTREESVTILVRLLGDEGKLNGMNYTPVFKDVPSDRWSYAYTMYCYENGITKGTADDEFSPEADVSAQQFVTLVLRLLGYTDAVPETALDMAQDLKLITADDASKFNLTNEFIRNDMTKIVYNALQIKTKQGTKLVENLNKKGVITDKELEQLNLSIDD